MSIRFVTINTISNNIIAKLIMPYVNISKIIMQRPMTLIKISIQFPSVKITVLINQNLLK